MLSGIGPREELEAHGIPVRVDLPGVGANLQDRYEVGVVSEMRDDRFTLLDGCSFAPPVDGETGDRCFTEWWHGKGAYTTNGAVVAIVAPPARPLRVRAARATSRATTPATRATSTASETCSPGRS